MISGHFIVHRNPKRCKFQSVLGKATKIKSKQTLTVYDFLYAQ
ncbi:hypothetical protein JCM19233_7003 [Vibrio astriarenae]|nr:hypothetical protein JCM19233_7003 [Vibrio sp. C7]